MGAAASSVQSGVCPSTRDSRSTTTTSRSNSRSSASAAASSSSRSSSSCSPRSSVSQAMLRASIEHWLQEAAQAIGAPSQEAAPAAGAPSFPSRVRPVLRIQLLWGDDEEAEEEQEAWDIILPPEFEDIVVPFGMSSSSDMRDTLRKQMLEVLRKQDTWHGLCDAVDRQLQLEDNGSSDRVTILTAFADVIFAMLVLHSSWCSVPRHPSSLPSPFT